MSLIKLRCYLLRKKENVLFLSKFCIRKCCIFTVKYLLNKDNAKFIYRHL